MSPSGMCFGLVYLLAAGYTMLDTSTSGRHPRNNAYTAPLKAFSHRGVGTAAGNSAWRRSAS